MSKTKSTSQVKIEVGQRKSCVPILFLFSGDASFVYEFVQFVTFVCLAADYDLLFGLDMAE